MSLLRCNALRPYLCNEIEPIHRTAHARLFIAFQRRCSHTPSDSFWSSTSFHRRIAELQDVHKHHEKVGKSFPGLLYPRMPAEKDHDLQEFVNTYSSLNATALEEHKDHVYHINGRVRTVREAGSRLLFLDIVDNDVKLQAMINFGTLQKEHGCSNEELRSFRKTICPGDYFSFQGYPIRTKSGEFSLYVTDLPKLLSPSLHTLPASVSDENTLARFPQLDLVLNRRRRDLLRLRHIIENEIGKYLDNLGFTKVTTPILGADTGGAIARPFATTSISYPSSQLKLRIAQELPLKKLVAAGLGRVYEIGPNFRNEGIDTTHNPEFTTCEFYRPYATLNDLMVMTEHMLVQIHQAILVRRTSNEPNLTSLPETPFLPILPFKRLHFIKTLAHAILPKAPSFRFPRSLTESSVPEFLDLFATLNIAVPENPTLPRLLDALGSYFLEPMCTEPTFITHYPAIMSPLAKSFIDPDTGHLVSARAELFVKGIEYANMYEEENDPFAQAQKFLAQARYLDEPEPNSSDRGSLREGLERLTPGQRYYIKVLEMGLPPTGGWGAGIERLVMLFGGAKRIGDVLPFGTLRGVVAMGTEVDQRGRTSDWTS